MQSITLSKLQKEDEGKGKEALKKLAKVVDMQRSIQVRRRTNESVFFCAHPSSKTDNLAVFVALAGVASQGENKKKEFGEES